MSGETPASQRLTSKDRRNILLLLLLGAATLALGLHLYPSVFPEATIRFELDRGASKERAVSFLRDQGIDLAGFRHASAFVFDDSAKVFLERTQGLERMNEAVAQTARIWRWSHRWFRPLQKEEYRVEIAPSGELVRFEHLLAEDAPGENLQEAAALQAAEAYLAKLRPAETRDLRYLGAQRTVLPNRTDHRFTWEREGVAWGEGRYRHEVTIRGDTPSGYAEFVKVPEAWARDYEALRSKNTSAGAVDSVFFILTFIAMLVVLATRIRSGGIRWHFAIVFGAIGAVLIFLSSLNSMPTAFHEYDTAGSMGGFVSDLLLQALMQALLLGAAIFIMVAAGESLYRSAYPRKLSLPRVFSWQGLRTKEFFYSSLGGLVMTCVFLAYQTVFYRIASSLGAWSPAEVPYDDLLNSAVPWVFLLFIGFMPSVTEEFTSRAFSIPLLDRLLRPLGRRASLVLALVLAGFIWGFGHAAYPNQPFYIRGLEVGLAGVLIGALMIRFNILYALVWHYTVDALYSGYLLLRSGNPYYVVSAALAGGVLVLPFVVALIAYLRTRRFRDPEDLRHESEPIRAPEGPIEESVPEPAVSTATSAAVLPVVRFSLRPLAVPILVTAVVLAGILAASARFKEPDSSIRVGRSEAGEAAEAFLRRMNIETAGHRSAIDFRAEASSDEARYIMEEGGLDALRSIRPGALPARTWGIRYFKPLDAGEIRVRVDAGSGSVVGFSRRIAEGESLRTVPPEEAERIAAEFLAAIPLSIEGLERKEASEEVRPKRTDHTLAWEAPPGDPRSVGEARYRVEATVTGDRPGSGIARIRLPEAYERQRERRTFATGVVLALMILGMVGSVGIVLHDAARAHMRGTIPWRRLLPVGAIAAAISLIATANSWNRFNYAYVTTVPWSNYMILFVVGLLTALVIYFFLGWAGTAVAHGLQPSIGWIADARARRRLWPGALTALVFVVAWGEILSRLDRLLAGMFPGSADPPLPGAGGVLDMSSPALAAVLSSWVWTFVGGIVAAAALRSLPSRDWPGRGARFGFAAATLIGISLSPARETGEALLNLLQVGVAVAVAWGLVRWVLRSNPLAYLLSIYALFAIRQAAELISQPSGWVSGQGLVALAALLLPWVWLGIRDLRLGRAAAELDGS